MRDHILKLHKKFAAINYAWQILLLSLANNLLPTIIVGVLLLADKGLDNGNRPKTKQLFLVVVTAPLIETILFQWAVYAAVKSICKPKNRPVYFLIGSSLLFGLSHNYSVAYIIFGVLAGLILAYTYLLYSDNTAKAIWSTFVVHALRNLSVYGLSHVSHVPWH